MYYMYFVTGAVVVEDEDPGGSGLICFNSSTFNQHNSFLRPIESNLSP